MKIGLPYIVMLGLIGLQSCASQSATLVHPQSGSTVRCEEQGLGLLAVAVGSRVRECLENYRAKGYVRTEDLTREQRDDLERRGVLSKGD